MARYKITTLSPVHIGSGEEYENSYNMLFKNGFVYVYDEFKIAEFFVKKGASIPSDINTLKQTIVKFKEEIVASNLHIRKIASNFTSLDKPLLEHVSSASKAIITGSSIKGSIRTAYLYQMVKNGDFKREQTELQDIDDKIEEADFEAKKRLIWQKKDLIKKIDRLIADKTKIIFRDLKVSDGFEGIQTQITRSINIKKEKPHQSNRDKKVQQISNFVESIQIGQKSIFTIDANDDYFKNLTSICNDFYKNGIEKEFENYFLDKKSFQKIDLKQKQFLLNIGRFGGAELKSIEEIRSLPRTGAEVDWQTSARTYAQIKEIQDKKYFENSLLPFGWVLCELME